MCDSFPKKRDCFAKNGYTAPVSRRSPLKASVQDSIRQRFSEKHVPWHTVRKEGLLRSPIQDWFRSPVDKPHLPEKTTGRCRWFKKKEHRHEPAM
jgi:hypothetical protein